MFYNVIIFILIVIVLVFGGLYNIFVRRFVGVNEVLSLMVKLKGRLFVKFKVLRGGK